MFKVMYIFQEEMILAELSKDPNPTPNVLFLPVSLDWVRPRKLPETTSHNYLHGTGLEMEPRLDKEVGAVRISSRHTK